MHSLRQNLLLLVHLECFLTTCQADHKQIYFFEQQQPFTVIPNTQSYSSDTHNTDIVTYAQIGMFGRVHCTRKTLL